MPFQDSPFSSYPSIPTSSAVAVKIIKLPKSNFEIWLKLLRRSSATASAAELVQPSNLKVLEETLIGTKYVVRIYFFSNFYAKYFSINTNIILSNMCKANLFDFPIKSETNSKHKYCRYNEYERISGTKKQWIQMGMRTSGRPMSSAWRCGTI